MVSVSGPVTSTVPPPASSVTVRAAASVNVAVACSPPLFSVTPEPAPPSAPSAPTLTAPPLVTRMPPVKLLPVFVRISVPVPLALKPCVPVICALIVAIPPTTLIWG